MLLGAFLHCASFGCIWVRSSSSSGRRLDGALGLDGTAAAAVLGRSAEADVSWTLLLLQHPHPRLTGWQLPGVSDKIGASDKIKQVKSCEKGIKAVSWDKEGSLRGREGESEERDNGFQSQLRRLLWTVHRGNQVSSIVLFFYSKSWQFSQITREMGAEI